MAEQQLQLGELERLDGQGNPVVTPDDEKAMYDKSLLEAEIPVLTDDDFIDSEEVLSDLSDDALTAMADAPVEEEVAPPSPDQYQGMATIYNEALQKESVTPEKLSLADMMGAAGSIGLVELDDLWKDVSSLDENARKAAAMSIIDDPSLTAEAKIRLIKETVGNAVPDMGIVEKAALTNAAQQQAALEDDPAFMEAAKEFISVVNPTAPELEKAYGTDAQQIRDVFDDVKELYSRAEENLSLLDIVEQALPVGSLPTLNKTVARIYRDLNITDPDVVGDEARPWVTVGNSLGELRQMYYYASPDMKKHMAEVIVKNLKRNTGLLQDTNDAVVMHVIANVLHPVVFDGKQYRDGAWIENSPEQERKLDQEIRVLSDKIRAQGGIPAQDPRVEKLLARRYNLPGPEQMFDNIFNLMDIGGVKGLLNATLRTGSKILPASVKRMLRIAPAKTTQNLVRAAVDPKTAAAMGTTQRGAVESFLARTDDVVEDGANGFVVMNAQAADAAEFVARSSMPLNLTASETAKALENFKSRFGYLVSKPRPKAQLHLSGIQPLEDGRGMAVEAVFGRTATSGWRSAGAARKASQEAAEEVFGVDSGLEIVRKDPDTGVFTVVGKETPDNAKGEYFQRVKETRLYSEDQDVWGTIVMPEDAVVNLGMGVGISQNAFGLNLFDKFHTNLISTHVRSWRALAGTFRGQMRAIGNLSPKDGLLLSKIVKKYEGQVLAPAKLARLARGNQKVIEGYRSYRQVTDTMYQVADRLSGVYLRRDGYSDIRINGSRAGFGKPLTQAEAPRRVFDPSTGQIVTLDAARVKGVYESGGSVVQLKHAVRDANGMPIKHLLADTKAGARVLPIPAHGTLPKIPGYYPHITQGNYWVRAQNALGEEEIIGVAQNKTDAQAFLDEIAAGNGPKGFSNARIDVDPALVNMEDWVQYMEELVNVRGGVIFGQRDGGSIRNLSPELGDAEMDPIGALLRGAELLSTISSKGEITASMRNRLYNYLLSKPGLLKEGPNGRLPAPREVTEALINKGTGDLDARRKAIAYLRQIELLEHSPDATRAASKAMYEGLAHLAYRVGQKDGVLGKAGKAVEVGLTKAQRVGTDPGGNAIGIAHRIYIATAVPYQRLVQTIQSSVVGMTSPTSYVKAWRMLMATDMAVRARLMSLHHGGGGFGQAVDKYALQIKPATDKMLREYSAKIAKQVGWEPDEFRDVVDAILSRGMIDSVAHNDTLRQGLSEASGRLMETKMTLADSFGAKVMRAGSKALGTLDETFFGTAAGMGFQGGERHNQLLSFLTWYIRDRAAGKANIKSAAYVDDLMGRVAVATGNMVREAAFPYTRWYTKVLTNWLQFPHKMAVLMMPERLGGPRNLSLMDKAKMVFTQYMLFGARSTPIAYAIWRGIEELVQEDEQQQGNVTPEEQAAFTTFWRSEPVQAAMEGFAFDYSVNKVLKAILSDPDDWRDFEFSKKLAPGAGHDFLLERLTAIGSMDAENFFGVIGKTGSKVMQYGQLVAGVTQARLNGADQEPWDKRAGMLVKEGLTTLVPMYGRYLTYRMVKDYGYSLSQGGAISDTLSNEFEGKMHMVFGIDTKDRASYYEAMAKLDQQYADPNAVQKEVKDAADTYWRELVLTGIKLNENNLSDDMWYAALNQHIRNHGLILSMYGEENGELINEEITKKLDRAIAGGGDSSETLFVERLTRLLGEGKLGTEGPDLYTYLKHEEFVKNNPKRMQMVQDAYQRMLWLKGEDE